MAQGGHNGDEHKPQLANFLQATFEAMDEGVTIYDDSLRLVSWNQRYIDIMGPGLTVLPTHGAKLLDLYTESAKQGLFGPGNPASLAKERIDAVQAT